MSGWNQFQIILYIWPVLILVLGYFTGKIIAQRHLARLDQAEAELSHIHIWTSPAFPDALRGDLPRGESALVVGNVTLGNDVFRSLIAAFQSVFGRNLSSFEGLCNRGRREAIIRMKIQADNLGAAQILQVRFEGYSILGAKGRTGGIEFLAYGTAVCASE
ncbi:YbjQ family protein [Robiginitomaculum antarcticum]|uniref:YbjQ family protein n=1 Tax=Robiginitomaculum antarcticum TaxID=437507 RepID=UPI00036B02D0|nr:heavy metal-binding domain-containing protein [Robiginitomaculum antarcticum]